MNMNNSFINRIWMVGQYQNKAMSHSQEKFSHVEKMRHYRMRMNSDKKEEVKERDKGQKESIRGTQSVTITKVLNRKSAEHVQKLGKPKQVQTSERLQQELFLDILSPQRIQPYLPDYPTGHLMKIFYGNVYGEGIQDHQKEGTGVTSSESEAGDGEFEPTAEMLVNDFDDERTLDEEEAMEEGSDRDEEEQNMPIEELLALYRYPQEEGEGETNGEAEGRDVEMENDDAVIENESEEVVEADNDREDAEDPDGATSRSSTSEENIIDPDKVVGLQLGEVRREPKPERKRREKASELAQLYADLDTNGDTAATSSSRSLRSGSRQQSEDEEDEDGEYSGEEEEDWRKTIMIGAAYQAQVPEGLQVYGATPPYENEDKLLWEPGKLTPKQVEDYLRALHNPPPGAQGVAALPLGKHVRDDEQALYLLLQCGYNVEEALRRHRMNPSPMASTMTLWSEEECRNFENGLKTYGKDFHLIQQNKICCLQVRTRSVGELVQFYYLWKKTERHDVFAAKTRIEKKKYFVHPGTTDYMDRFLDEGEGVASWRDRSSSPSIYSLLYGSRSNNSSSSSNNNNNNNNNNNTSSLGQQVTPAVGLVSSSIAAGTQAALEMANGSHGNAVTSKGTASSSSSTSNNTSSSSATYENSTLSQMEDLARHLDHESLESLSKFSKGSSSSKVDVGMSITSATVLNSPPLSIEAKTVAKTGTVAQ
ncbi:uncharacterized protein LOC143039867 isoform X4 [Oratosquilla oratoria]|uniref:uncharacterized protein LOC143039867 isoform X4 n=1 Tax=Oratosquilla oratoria TaxID=337810 RepID=UPI003F763ECA